MLIFLPIYNFIEIQNHIRLRFGFAVNTLLEQEGKNSVC